jgi:3-hydroxyacyl-CoA dehydrogenase/enoyl-CoA hydratase/3-hydroxybutyryl-CoA epimerase
VSQTSPTFEVDRDGVGWITFDDPTRPVNVLDGPVMTRLAGAVGEAREAAREGHIRAVVVRSAKAASFIVGADIDQIGSLEDPREAERRIRLGQAVYDEIADLAVPTVAAIHGACLGGGLELALACDHRVVSDADETKLGLPEVMLGIVPAWGGTSRLPRLVGLQAALDLLLTGKQASASKAVRIGLAAERLPAEIFDEMARGFALAIVSDPARGAVSRRSLATRALDDTPIGRLIVLRTAHKRVLAETGGNYPAPLRILEILADTLAGPLEQGLDAEARAAAELIVSPVCKNLVHVYRLREAARKGKALGEPPPSARDVSALGVLGAGVMGGGIAQLAAYNGIRVYMKDIRHDAVGGGLQHAKALFDKAVERRKLSRRDAAQRMELIAGGLDYRGLRAADLVVEAIVERMDVKRSVLRETEARVSERCVMATNTSSLSVDQMAEALTRPERFCGMHFFNPVHRMPLVEVIRGARSSDECVATVYRLALRLGKVPVVVRDGPGFLVNRILGPYLNEAGYLLGDGATIAEIDGVAKSFGMPMGPLRLIDEVGHDVSAHAGAALHRALGSRLAPAPVLEALGATERLGRKGGSGFYRYEDGKEHGIDESVYEALGRAVPADREVPEQAIRDRLFVAMINEGARVLEDRIAASAADVDLAMIMGTGFPPFRGGLLRFADTVHARALLDTIRVLESAHGPRFAPAPLIERLAAEDRRFYDLFPAPAS